MPPLRVTGLLAGALVLLAALVALSPSAQAAGEELKIPPDYRHVIEGDSVEINVTFGVRDTEERITVTCQGCPLWDRTVTYSEEKSNCHISDAGVNESGAQESRRYCLISFPSGFANDDGGPPPTQTGEPSLPREYTVRMGDVGQGEVAETSFNAHLSSAGVCRSVDDGSTVARRNDVLMLSTSGHPQGETFTLKIRDGQRVFFEWTVTSQGAEVAYHRRWHVPLDFPLQGDQRELEITVDAPSGSEREPLLVRPGIARPVVVREPGAGLQDLEYNRTQTVQFWTAYQFHSAPRDCEEVAWDRRLATVTEENVQGDAPTAIVRRLSDPPSPSPVQTVDTADSTFRRADNLFLVNYTIPKDEQTSNPDSEDPLYDIMFEQTQLPDGNYIGEVNSTDYEVYPYDIVPEFEVLQDEVERLETARLVMNLTYADGEPFTPEDMPDDDETLNVEFGLEDQGPETTFEANHREAGIWNVSDSLGFEYEPLGAYTWRVERQNDNNGDPGEQNRIPRTVTERVDVVSARPLLNLTTLVDSERVNGTERTRTVQVRLDAHFKNGVPLTDGNVDPSLGGVVLNVNKRNQFERIVDQDRLVMTHAGQPGSWVESFRVGRSPDAAPAGPWNLEIVARDDRTPPNVNISKFPFDVRPANVTPAVAKSPPPLVNGTKVPLEFRLHYPDGSLVTERLVDQARGGDLEVTLERVTGADEPAEVEQTVEPRPISGGQAWKVELNASKIPPGNHFFNITGQDIHGNPIGPRATDLFTILFNGEFRNSTTPICPGTNGTASGGCDVERGETVYVVFPGASGDESMFEGDHPLIRVHRQDPDSGRWILFRNDVWLSPEQFFNISGRDVGNNHVGRFVTETSTPTGTYRLVILGRAQDGQGFAGFSQTFNVTRVSVTREIIQPLPDAAKKTEEISARIEHQPGDVIDTAVAQAGPVRIRNIETSQSGVGTFVTWRPPSSFPTGPASIQLEGRDLFGNPFEVTLGPMELEPVEIRVQQESDVGDRAPRGELFTFSVRMTYETGASFTDDDGVPTIRVEDREGNQVDTARAVHRVDTWQVRWRPDADLPPGQYRLVITGTDESGNVIEDFSTEPIEVTAGTITGEVTVEPRSTVQRGGAVQARVNFPTAIVNGSATVTTGTTPVGQPRVQVNDTSVSLTFSTDRSTELVDAKFVFTGTDVVGNDLTAETQRFSIAPQQMNLEWVQQPPTEITTDENARGAFIVEYPDGTLMRPGEGAVIVGLFAGEQPLGSLDAQPLEENPAVWQVTWQPPDDVRNDIPYHFSASARDTFRNEAPPVASTGFFVQDPTVPDYVPAPGPGPGVLVALLAGLALLAQGGHRWRQP